MVASSNNFKTAAKSMEELMKQKEVVQEKEVQHNSQNLNTIIEENENPKSSRIHKQPELVRQPSLTKIVAVP